MKLVHVDGNKNISDFLSRIPSHEKCVIFDGDELVDIKNFTCDKNVLALTRSTAKTLQQPVEKLFDQFITTHNALNKTPSSIKITNAPVNENDDTDFVYFINKDLFNLKPNHAKMLRNKNIEVGEIISDQKIHFLVFRNTENSLITPQIIFTLLMKLKNNFEKLKINKFSVISPNVTAVPLTNNAFFKRGDQVFMKNILHGTGRKLQHRYKGPYVVLESLNEQNVKILVDNKEKIVHKNLLTKYNV
ncbi:CLUMA_CG002692, isoform A [Clunio marinus]|uniref:CLUMA_CG002692, isoform A n=1 Tax=Clunio marinus TaxID=568069 RepID=A0A1J1HN20_9DIPT|nr:CLUMA_CG002692, isoform A [Clunio marinus]